MKINNEFHQRRGCIFVFITAIARIFGLITLVGLAVLTYLEWLAVGSENFRIYITIVTTIVAYLELLWIFDKCINCCICCFRSETCFYWICCIPVDNWLRTIIYVGLSIPLFIPTWLSTGVRMDMKIIGVLLVITGLLYFIKTFKYKRINIDDHPKEDDNLVDQSSSRQTSTTTIDNDTPPSAFAIDQEGNLKH